MPFALQGVDMERIVILIVGPPASGKSTLAASLGLDHYEREQYPSDRAFRAAVRRAAARPGAQMAVVRTCSTLAEQRRWERDLATTRTIVMDTPADECRRRAHQRARPGWRGEVTAITRWFEGRRKPDTTTLRTPAPRSDATDPWLQHRTWKAVTAYWRKRLALHGLDCARCGGPISRSAVRTGASLHVGHIVSRVQAREMGWSVQQANALSNTQPEHAHCSTSAGGRDMHARRRMRGDEVGITPRTSGVWC